MADDMKKAVGDAGGTVGKRVVAMIIDSVPLAIIAWVVQSLLVPPVRAIGVNPYDPYAGYNAAMQYANHMSTGYLVAMLFNLVLFVGYFAFFEGGGKQASFGKKLMGLKVTKMGGGGLSRAEALKRSLIFPGVASVGGVLGYFFSLFSTLGGLAALVIAVMILFDENKRGIHDKMTDSVVVDA